MQPKILIIDDNKGDIRLIKELFEEAGLDYQILWAEDGEQGLEIAKKEDPEVAFLDINMPKLNGFEVCTRLKNISTKNVYVIIMTGNLENVSKLKPASYSADGFCGKDPNQILNEMIKYLRQKSKESQEGK